MVLAMITNWKRGLIYSKNLLLLLFLSGTRWGDNVGKRNHEDWVFWVVECANVFWPFFHRHSPYN